MAFPFIRIQLPGAAGAVPGDLWRADDRGDDLLPRGTGCSV